MTIQVITGCIAGDILVDAVSFMEISESQMAKVEKKVMAKILKENPTYTINKEGHFPLLSILPLLSPESWDSESEPCEMCGETVSWKIYNI